MKRMKHTPRSRPGTRPRTRARTRARIRRSAVLAAAFAVTVLTTPAAAVPLTGDWTDTESPVEHLVVVFDENVSFDHYFATYPHAANTDGTPFTPDRSTPATIDNLRTAGLLRRNPNQYPPRRLSARQVMTCDQNHSYGPEQYAANGGKADQYVQNTDSGKCSGKLFGEPGLVMDYYDGNTVTALWNYAQHYALNDHSFSTTYGPSTPGAINLVSGQTHGVVSTDPASGTEHPERTAKPDPRVVAAPDAAGVGTLLADPEPAYDDCSGKDRTGRSPLAEMTGRTIGDVLTEEGVSWGWFQGGFRPSTPWDGQPGHYARCSGRTHANAGGTRVIDYSPHHEPFQYYRSTANPHHLAPRSVAEIGHAGRANHQYDLTDFDAALRAGRLPAVSFLKAPAAQDGHAGYSGPADEQRFLVEWINKIQNAPQWKDTAVVIAYDDSDGWYDHAYAAPRNGSRLAGKGPHGKPLDGPACRAAPAAAGGYEGRCGPGPRQPLLVISPYSKVNAVDHTPTEQTSVLKFIEWNWGTDPVGGSSFDTRAGSLLGMFDFAHPNGKRVLLNDDGSVRSVGDIPTVEPETTEIIDGDAPEELPAGPEPVALAAGGAALSGATALLLHRRARRAFRRGDE